MDGTRDWEETGPADDQGVPADFSEAQGAGLTQSDAEEEAFGAQEDGEQEDAAREDGPQAFRRMAMRYAPAALRTLAQIVDSEKATNADKIRAANIVIERAHGKTSEAMKPRASKQAMAGMLREELERMKKEERETKGESA